MRKPSASLILALGLWWLLFLPHRWMPDPAGTLAIGLISEIPGAWRFIMPWQAASWFRLIPQILLFAILFKRRGGIDPFRPRLLVSLLPRALIVALATSLLAMLFALPVVGRLLISAGADRFPGPFPSPSPAPTLPPVPSDGASPFSGLPLSFLPAFLVTALCVGYREEIFFRFYLPLVVAAELPVDLPGPLFKLRPWLPALVQAMLFAVSHWRGGVRTFLFSLVLALLYGMRARKRGDLHELALGHAFYDLPLMAMSHGFLGS